MSTTVSETIGERIRRLRYERGLSQRDLECDGVTAAYISFIESSRKQASLTVLIKLAERLNVSALYLLTGSKEGLCPMCGRES